MAQASLLATLSCFESARQALLKGSAPTWKALRSLQERVYCAQGSPQPSAAQQCKFPCFLTPATHLHPCADGAAQRALLECLWYFIKAQAKASDSSLPAAQRKRLAGVVSNPALASAIGEFSPRCSINLRRLVLLSPTCLARLTLSLSWSLYAATLWLKRERS